MMWAIRRTILKYHIIDFLKKECLIYIQNLNLRAIGSIAVKDIPSSLLLDGIR